MTTFEKDFNNMTVEENNDLNEITKRIIYAEDVITSLKFLKEKVDKEYEMYSGITDENFDLIINEYTRNHAVLLGYRNSLIRRMIKGNE